MCVGLVRGWLVTVSYIDKKAILFHMPPQTLRSPLLSKTPTALKRTFQTWRAESGFVKKLIRYGALLPSPCLKPHANSYLKPCSPLFVSEQVQFFRPPSIAAEYGSTDGDTGLVQAVVFEVRPCDLSVGLDGSRNLDGRSSYVS